MKLTCFKAYDIRGKLGEELNEDVAYRIGRAYADFLSAKQVVVGGDVRQSSALLKRSLADGLMDGGQMCWTLGWAGTAMASTLDPPGVQCTDILCFSWI